MATATKKKSKVTLQPLGDKVVIERDESEDVTSGGIVLPDSAKDKPSRGTVVAIGTGKLLAPETITIGEDEFLLMSESDILAVVE